MGQLDYDPILITFMSTLGESLQTRSHSVVLERFLQRIVANEYRENNVGPIDMRNIITEGQKYIRESSKEERERFREIQNKNAGRAVLTATPAEEIVIEDVGKLADRSSGKPNPGPVSPASALKGTPKTVRFKIPGGI